MNSETEKQLNIDKQKSKKKEAQLLLNTKIVTENLFSSWIRVTVILFSFGITLTVMSTNKYKDRIALALYLLGIIIGVTSIYTYCATINSINKGDFLLPADYTYNIYAILFMLIVLSIMFFMKYMKIKNRFI